ncbi:sterol desaturase family protein [Flavobacteriaceae bacterium]|uniref:sterol desaturase family protein n=1 Tax=Candidatus Arcticimaribacter forsetii TaxID=2820661 RepID=UPI002076D61F|nr:sterol desaturase family protein [Candidatus Arcticimaribacter forsetii]MDA8640550.1 sterol desaturase family protein [Flavobacteriaceae bacterium]MDB4751698.1 sterol desaturase family protein [Flavobacteriaceae bacterium]
MEQYAAVLLWAIPSFLVLVVIEIVYGHLTNKQTYTLMDTLSSLSSGMTNTLKETLGLALVIISYPFILKNIALIELESSSALYFIAFICIDFASYWNHRLNHKINIFWNRHVIHHSSEEFNLACALRQSISSIFGFGALFLIPAAILGVPPKVISILAPLHLFGQFWYHTRHIGKLGWLEYILVTPSQHRVHHAINPIYIDKNLSAIFCIWDRLFGTFQEELDDEPPVYGVLKPVQTWNPIWINFQHFWAILTDAWYAKNWIDKLRVWFMPTGWRPKDVQERFPRTIIENVHLHEKYNPEYSFAQKAIGIFHFIIINLMILYFLSNFVEISNSLRLGLGFLIFGCIFSFTSLMDLHSWAIKFQIAWASIALIILWLPNLQFLFIEFQTVKIGLTFYFGISIILTNWNTLKAPTQTQRTN